MKKALRIIHVVGARPNFVKISSILRACSQAPEIESLLVHTGQHYSENMSRSFFEALEIPFPNVNLEVGSASHARQTAEIMKRFEPVVMKNNPDAVLVVGDVYCSRLRFRVRARVSGFSTTTYGLARGNLLP